MPWQSLAHPGVSDPALGFFQQAVAGFCLLLVGLAWRSLPHKAYALYSLLLILPPFFSGTLASFARYIAVSFPLFLGLAAPKDAETIEHWLIPAAWMLQGLLFAGWVRNYPVY